MSLPTLIPSSNSTGDLASHANSNRISMASNDSTTSALAARLTSLMSTAYSGSNNELVPIAFLPMSFVLPCMMQQQQQQQQHNHNLKYFTEDKSATNKSNILDSNNLVNSRGVSPSTSIISNTSSMLSHQQQQLVVNVSDLPHVELHVPIVDFGQIAEGCVANLRLFLKVNPNNKSKRIK